MTYEESLTDATKRVEKWPEWKKVGLQTSPNKKETTMLDQNVFNEQLHPEAEKVLDEKQWDLVGNNYWKDCPDCHGTGCISQKLYDPPEQCYCDQVDPEMKESIDNLSREDLIELRDRHKSPAFPVVQSKYLDPSEITDALLQELGRVPCEDIQTDVGPLTGVELLYVTIEGYQPPFCLFSDENADDYRVCVSSRGTTWNVSPGDVLVLRSTVDEMRKAKEAE